MRAGTTMSVGWIADRVNLGSRQYATKLLYLRRRKYKHSKK